MKTSELSVFAVDKQTSSSRDVVRQLPACLLVDRRYRYPGTGNERVTRVEWKIQFRLGTTRSRAGRSNFLPLSAPMTHVISPAGTITRHARTPRTARRYHRQRT